MSVVEMEFELIREIEALRRLTDHVEFGLEKRDPGGKGPRRYAWC